MIWPETAPLSGVGGADRPRSGEELGGDVLAYLDWAALDDMAAPERYAPGRVTPGITVQNLVVLRSYGRLDLDDPLGNRSGAGHSAGLARSRYLASKPSSE